MPSVVLAGAILVVVSIGLILPRALVYAQTVRQCAQTCAQQKKQCLSGFKSRFRMSKGLCEGDSQCTKAEKQTFKRNKRECKNASKRCKSCCRTGPAATCSVTVCGDGLHVPDEECDDGITNSDSAPDACRTACVLPRCGDGVIDAGLGEQCDPPAIGSCDPACVLENRPPPSTTTTEPSTSTTEPPTSTTEPPTSTTIAPTSTTIATTTTTSAPQTSTTIPPTIPPTSTTIAPTSTTIATTTTTSAPQTSTSSSSVTSSSVAASTTTTVLPPPCVGDPSRTIFAGYPGAFPGPCRRFDGDPTACGQAWAVSAAFGVVSCFFDVPTSTCEGCGPLNQAQGRCTNACAAPPANGQ